MPAVAVAVAVVEVVPILKTGGNLNILTGGACNALGQLLGRDTVNAREVGCIGRADLDQAFRSMNCPHWQRRRPSSLGMREPSRQPSAQYSYAEKFIDIVGKRILRATAGRSQNANSTNHRHAIFPF